MLPITAAKLHRFRRVENKAFNTPLVFSAIFVLFFVVAVIVVVVLFLAVSFNDQAIVVGYSMSTMVQNRWIIYAI